MSTIRTLGEQARAASFELLALDTAKKNKVLASMADALEASRSDLKEANQKDLEAGRAAEISSALLDRLGLTDSRTDAMIQGVRDIIDLPDPVGGEIKSILRPNGLEIKKVRVPIGVIGFIYESRPNVTVDSTALCFKSSNAIILRGGKEAIESNKVISKALVEGGVAAGMPEHAVQLVQTTDREAVKELVQLEGLVDVVIPRGGEGLINAVTDMARVPVLKHYKGVCHIYVDDSADLAKAASIVQNAKCQRPGVCNAMETLLVHKDVAEGFVANLPELLTGVEIRGDEAVQKLIPSAKAASEEDWHAEYLDLILAVKVVDSVDSAIAHINEYGSRHTDAIVTGSAESTRKFQNQVDASTVCVNASTRFADGSVFGMGAEIGISTDKLHARGPMGLEDLTTYKYLVAGNGQIRE